MTDQEFKKYMERSPEECMRVVFDEYCNYVYVIAATKLKNCGTTEDIEECVSDVFTEVFERIYRSYRQTQSNRYVQKT